MNKNVLKSSIQTETMSKELHRYLFTVRQQFNSEPNIDSFYKLTSPSGMTGAQIKTMTVLKPGWEQDSLSSDSSAFKGMSLRLRFNSDMFQRVCLVKSISEITSDELDSHIQLKYKEQKLAEFLDESAV